MPANCARLCCLGDNGGACGAGLEGAVVAAGLVVDGEASNAFGGGGDGGGTSIAVVVVDVVVVVVVVVVSVVLALFC